MAQHNHERAHRARHSDKPFPPQAREPIPLVLERRWNGHRSKPHPVVLSHLRLKDNGAEEDFAHDALIRNGDQGEQTDAGDAKSVDDLSLHELAERVLVLTADGQDMEVCPCQDHERGILSKKASASHF